MKIERAATESLAPVKESNFKLEFEPMKLSPRDNTGANSQKTVNEPTPVQKIASGIT